MPLIMMVMVVKTSGIQKRTSLRQLPIIYDSQVSGLAMVGAKQRAKLVVTGLNLLNLNQIRAVVRCAITQKNSFPSIGLILDLMSLA